jgi:hypothetical protein
MRSTWIATRINAEIPIALYDGKARLSALTHRAPERATINIVTRVAAPVHAEIPVALQTCKKQFIATGEIVTRL